MVKKFVCMFGVLFIVVAFISVGIVHFWVSESAIVALDPIEIGDYENNLPLVVELANKGDVHAQYVLGVMYANGRGVEQDYKKAVEWYKQAVRKKHIAAQYDLALMYANGQGVERDYRKALKLYKNICGTRRSVESMQSCFSVGQWEMCKAGLQDGC